MAEEEVDTHVEASSSFVLRDCALIGMATGRSAQNLREFRDGMVSIPADSIYHHFWGRLLRAQFDEPEYNNDFASWAQWGLHDKSLAERLSVLSPTDFPDLESLRQEVVEVVEQRLDEAPMVPWAQADKQFYFLKAQIVLFDTGLRFDDPRSVVAYLPALSTGSIYYHFIDARSRTEEHWDDFSVWLSGFEEDYSELIQRLRHVDPYFSSLKELRYIVQRIFSQYFA